MFKIQYDGSKKLKQDKQKLFKDIIYAKKIKKSIENLWEFFPELQNLKRLEPKKDHRYRLRVWDYRIIFSVDFGNKILIIHRIALRKDIYK